MNEVLTIEEIYARFPSEWVLLDEPEVNESLEVQSGRLLFHSKDRHELDREAMELRPKRFALFFTGSIPEGMAVVL